MSTDPADRVVSLCPRCNQPLSEVYTRTAIWQGERMVVIEDIRAEVCGTCNEQYYDDDVSEAIRRLSEEGFPSAEAVRTQVVEVFSLKGRTRKRMPLPEDTYVD